MSVVEDAADTTTNTRTHPTGLFSLCFGGKTRTNTRSACSPSPKFVRLRNIGSSFGQTCRSMRARAFVASNQRSSSLSEQPMTSKAKQRDGRAGKLKRESAGCVFISNVNDEAGELQHACLEKYDSGTQKNSSASATNSNLLSPKHSVSSHGAYSTRSLKRHSYGAVSVDEPESSRPRSGTLESNTKHSARISSFSDSMSSWLSSKRRNSTVAVNADGSASRQRTIRDFGYYFNEEGQFRRIEGDTPFVFEVSKDNTAYNQANYEAVGEAVTEHVYHLLESSCRLNRICIPLQDDADGGLTDDPQSFFFASPDFDKAQLLLVLIHGSGVVRAGQWSRRLIINDSLESGTQIPYIKRALGLNYGVVVLNTNNNAVVRPDGFKERIPNSETPERHATYVWKQFVATSAAKSVAIVAHSYGGIVTLTLAAKFSEFFIRRVKAIAFTDSVHPHSLRTCVLQRNLKLNNDIHQHITRVAQNWVASADILNKPQRKHRGDITRVSAGTTKHEETSHTAIEAVFSFLEEKMTHEDDSP